jgi:HPr kinase/phosphorylase
MAGAAASEGGTACTLHATCVAWQERGILILGPSGSGKSDLALRLIEAGARLVADDQVRIERRGRELLARPVALAGLIELRGLGVFELPALAEVPLALGLRLAPAADQERLPAPATLDVLGMPLRTVAIDPAGASAVARVRMALFGKRVE